jgi:hypothetical protein
LSLGKDCVSKDSNLTMPLGSLIALSYTMKEITNALEGAGRKRVEAEGSQKVAMMTNMHVLAIGVTYVELVPHLYWKTKVYDMVSGKSRCVPNVMLRSFIPASWSNLENYNETKLEIINKCNLNGKKMDHSKH